MSKYLDVITEIGEKGATVKPCHILVTTPNFIGKNISGRGGLNLTKLKMVIYDEADEIFLQEGN